MSPPPPTAAAAADTAPYAAVPAVSIPRPAVRDGTLVGIGFIVLSTLFFSVGDIVAKEMTMTVDALQVTWFRFVVFALTIPLVVVALRGPRILATRRPGLQLLRGLAIAGGSTFFIVGLGHLGVAENTAIAYLGPLFITALSIPLLGEVVGVRRWAAALVGFLGVMIVVRPGTDAFQLAALFPVGAALVGAFGSVFTRMMADEAPETTLAWTAIVGFVSISVMMPFVWEPTTIVETALGVGTGLLSTIGHVFVVLAFRKAGASLLAPFTYVQLLFAGGLSWLVFAEVPSAYTIVGGLVIAASGLYTAHRERVRAREARARAAV